MADGLARVAAALDQHRLAAGGGSQSQLVKCQDLSCGNTNYVNNSLYFALAQAGDLVGPLDVGQLSPQWSLLGFSIKSHTITQE